MDERNGFFVSALIRSIRTIRVLSIAQNSDTQEVTDSGSCLTNNPLHPANPVASPSSTLNLGPANPKSKTCPERSRRIQNRLPPCRAMALS